MAVRTPVEDLMTKKIERMLGENSQFQMRLSPQGKPMATRSLKQR
jgi:hypothetical protein